ncbi:MAG TPA: hypothetical protein VFQ67_08010 [Allosphingosinicella sp.]|nr:hypothetical protein [Allosphingosinicella sp.]
MNPNLVPIVCAALAALQSTAAPAPSAQDKNDLHPALIAEEGIGDVVVYLSDDFRRSAPAAAEPLNVITIERSNPGDAFNSPGDDMNGLHRYMKANSGFAAKELVAVASSRDLIRVYFRGEHGAMAGSFKYPRAKLGRADPAVWARLRRIAVPDFSRYMAKFATRQAEGERWALGPRVPVAQGRAILFQLGIEAASAARARSLASELKRRHPGGPAFQVTSGPGTGLVELRARFPFSEESFQRLMNGICADAAKSGAECVSWSARFEPIELTL